MVTRCYDSLYIFVFFASPMGHIHDITAMEVHRTSHGGTVEVPQMSHGIKNPTEASWKFHANTTEIPWEFRGPTESPTEIPWNSHRNSMEVPRKNDRSPMGTPTSHGGRIETPRKSHGSSEVPWKHQETPMGCLLYTSPSPRDQRGSRMPSSA